MTRCSVYCISLTVELPQGQDLSDYWVKGKKGGSWLVFKAIHAIYSMLYIYYLHNIYIYYIIYTYYIYIYIYIYIFNLQNVLFQTWTHNFQAYGHEISFLYQPE